MTLISEEAAETAATYRRFAEEDARGRSPLYAELSQAVAADEEVLRFLLALPCQKRQPNLLFAALRHLCGTPGDWREFRARLFANAEAIRALMLSRATQTNEAARCATLLPVLAQLPQPLALIEVGASAGLCLLPDLYGYDYGRAVLRPDAPLVLRCRANGAAPLPREVPRVVWRAGLDLNPLDVARGEDLAWLESLIWPEQTHRLATLRAAAKLAAAAKPRIVAGDLRTDLPQLCAQAPQDATLVVFHTAVLAYVSAPVDRQRFAEEVRSLCRYWISNEAPSVFPSLPLPLARPSDPSLLLLSVNGSPVAWTDGHGASLEWIGAATPGQR